MRKVKLLHDFLFFVILYFFLYNLFSKNKYDLSEFSAVFKFRRHCIIGNFRHNINIYSNLYLSLRVSHAIMSTVGMTYVISMTHDIISTVTMTRDIISTVCMSRDIINTVSMTRDIISTVSMNRDIMSKVSLNQIQIQFKCVLLRNEIYIEHKIF